MDPPGPSRARRPIAAGRRGGGAPGRRRGPRRLAAVVDFREQLGRRPVAIRLYHGYPFDRLRRRLGLEPVDPDAVDPADLSCAPAWELAALDPATLDDHRLGDAVASAVGLRDDAITTPMGIELLRRSIPIAGVSLVGAVSPLVRRAMGGGDPDVALDWIDRARPRAVGRTAEILDVWRAEILCAPADPTRRCASIVRSSDRMRTAPRWRSRRRDPDRQRPSQRGPSAAARGPRPGAGERPPLDRPPGAGPAGWAGLRVVECG